MALINFLYTFCDQQPAVSNNKYCTDTAKYQFCEVFIDYNDTLPIIR